MNEETPENSSLTQNPQDYSSLNEEKTWVDTLAWYLLVMGFISILTGGLFFWLYRQGSLRHAEYVLNGNALGSYLLIIGVASYMVGRGLSHYRRLRRRRF
jgi:hypothetical protein